MKKVLITGASGLLGQYLNLKVSEKFEILSCYKINIGNCKQFLNTQVNICEGNEINNLFQKFKPNIVIHAAAIANPVPYENQTSKDYFYTNVNATRKIAQLCEQHNSKLIYISTDLVYAGYRGSFLKEDAKLIPASLYAETKLVGESKVKESASNYLILRTALLFGFGINHSQCHFQFIYNELQKNKTVNLFTDQYRTPLSLNDAAIKITELATMDLENEVINLGGCERVSRYEMGEMLCSVAGFDKNLLQKITMDEIPNFPKVEDVSLNTEKLQSLGLKPRGIEENIYEIVKRN